MTRPETHIRRCLEALACMLLLAGCVPAASPGGPAGNSAPAAVTALPAPAPKLDLSCRVGGDCAVRNVGNCCGYFPACVNKDSVVDPDAVRAECARTGTSAVCGFRDIQACECVSGQCQAADRPIGTTH